MRRQGTRLWSLLYCTALSVNHHQLFVWIIVLGVSKEQKEYLISFSIRCSVCKHIKHDMYLIHCKRKKCILCLKYPFSPGAMFVKTVCEQSDVGHVPTVKSRFLNLFFDLTYYSVRSQQRCNGMKGAYVMFILYILISDVDLRETTMQGEDQGLQ